MAHSRPDDGQGVRIHVTPGLLEPSMSLIRSPADQQWHDHWVQTLARSGLSAHWWATRHPCDRALEGCWKVYLGRPAAVGDPDRAHWGAVLLPVPRRDRELLLVAFGRRHPRLPTGEPIHPDVYDVATRVVRLLAERTSR